MAQDIRGGADDQRQEPIDCDALWGPLAHFRPAKNRPFTNLRALLLAVVVGGFFGLGLDLIAALCSGGIARLPSVYAIPLLLTCACHMGLESLVVPVWNRRAHWLNRRQNYLAQLENER